MKIIALDINKQNNNEAPTKLFQFFLNGLIEGGALVEYYNIANMRIEKCRACTSTNDFLSDGKCRCNDDFTAILPSLRASDAWVFAYHNNSNRLSPAMSTILDRIEPLFEPNFVDFQSDDFPDAFTNGYSRRLVLISTSAKWELAAFDNIVEQLHTFSSLYHLDFLPPLLRPHSNILTKLIDIKIDVEDIFNSAFSAGLAFAQKESIPSEHVKNISRQLISKDSFLYKMLYKIPQL